MFLRNIRIIKKMQLLLLIFIIGFTGFAALVLYSFYSLTSLQIKPTFFREAKSTIEQQERIIYDSYALSVEIMNTEYNEEKVKELNKNVNSFNELKKNIKKENIGIELYNMLEKSYIKSSEYNNLLLSKFIDSYQKNDTASLQNIFLNEITPIKKELALNIDASIKKADALLIAANNESSAIFFDRLKFLFVIFFPTLLLVIVFSIIIINSIKPLSLATAHLIDLTNGEIYQDFPEKFLKQKDEIGQLSKAIMQITISLRERAKGIEYQKNEVDRLANNLKLLAVGNLEFDLEIEEGNIYTKNEYENFNKIKNHLEKVKESLMLMANDTNKLTHSALNGELSSRADISSHQGEFQKIIIGINDTLDAIINPINEVSNVMENISIGNLNLNIQTSYKGDFDKLTKSVNKTVSTLQNIVYEISEILEQISNGILDMDPIRDYEGDYSKISESMNSIIDSLNYLLGDINKASEEVAKGSRQVSEGSIQLSQGATEQASSIEELSASITQVTSQTKTNAENASQANYLALEAKESAVKGNERMKDMLKAMEDINFASENISKIIKVIDEIAFQTNILALNAAVEAARAGQHGKGFAVVAEEVRNLAARSSEAANETTEYIKTSIKKVDGGTKIANETATSLLGIVESSVKVANLVGDIAEASSQQAGAISQINLGVDQVSKVVQTNSATSEQSSAASEELMTQAQMLSENVSKFKLRENNEYEEEKVAIKKVDRKNKSQISIGKKNDLRTKLTEYGKY